MASTGNGQITYTYFKGETKTRPSPHARHAQCPKRNLWKSWSYYRRTVASALLPFSGTSTIVASTTLIYDATNAGSFSHVRGLHFIGSLPDFAQAHGAVESIENRQRHRYMGNYRPRPQSVEIELNRMAESGNHILWIWEWEIQR